MQELNGHVAVVTGAASGIGLGMARRFAAEGMKVVLADVEQGPLDAAVQTLRSAGGEVIGIRTDVRYEEQVQALADATIDTFGAVHVVCNNAGVETGGLFAEISSAAWQWVLHVNVMGVVHGCKVFLPLLRKQDEGHIVNTGSGASFTAQLPTFAPYIASKFAVLGLSESLDMELRAGGENIGVTLLEPIAKTNMPNAERNKPTDVPATNQLESRRKVFAAMSAHDEEMAFTVEDVAEAVVKAIHDRTFFALLQPEMVIGAVRDRLRWLEDGVPTQQLKFASPAPAGLGEEVS